ncbi:MAG: hypothetical protein K2X81_06310 [Candidatus Obscuribacterales bacterium]|nr:hypothetical protein [Candidatus Obscuribacterales bacterium]
MANFNNRAISARSAQQGPKAGDVFEQAVVKFILSDRQDKSKLVAAIVALKRSDENGLTDSGYTAMVDVSQAGAAAEQLKPGLPLGSVVITESYPARDGKTQNANGRNYKASRTLQARSERELAKKSALAQAIAEERILTVKVTGHRSEFSMPGKSALSFSNARPIEVVTGVIINDPYLEGMEAVIALSEITMTAKRRYVLSKEEGNAEVVKALRDTTINAMVLPESSDRTVVLSQAKAYKWALDEILDDLLEDLGTTGAVTFTVDAVKPAAQYPGDVFLSKAVPGGITVYAHTTTRAWSDRELPLPQVNDQVEATLVRTFDHELGYKMFSVKPVLNQFD